MGKIRSSPGEPCNGRPDCIRYEDGDRFSSGAGIVIPMNFAETMTRFDDDGKFMNAAADACMHNEERK